MIVTKFSGAVVTGIVTATIFGACTSLFNSLIGSWSHQIEGFCCYERYIIPAFGFLFGAGGYGFMQWIRWEILRKLLTYRNWIYNPKSWRTKLWGMLLSTLVPKKTKLYAFQEYLPKYPLPKLEDTCRRTLEMVKPILSAQDYILVVDAMRDFQNNEGHKLQKVLEKRYKTEENWLSEFWDKYVYLAGRNPIPVHSNFSCNGEKNKKYNDPSKKALAIAGNLAHHFMTYKEKVEKGSLLGMMIQNIVPISCDRYKYVCSTTRIPRKDIDELRSYPNAKHIVVFRKNSMYKLNLYNRDVSGNESLLTPFEIQCQFEFIVRDAEQVEKNSPKPVINPSVFTTTSRPRWAKIRETMIRNELNSQSLNDVESAAFCMILTEDNPMNESEEFKHFLTGKGFDRWFDKSMCFIVEENGAIGYNVEHTTAEATLSGRMFEYGLYWARYDEKGNATHQNLAVHRDFEKPQILKWDLDEFQSDIDDIEKEWSKLVDDVDTCVYFLKKGKGFMKKLRVSPDGYMQMALQLAFYRLHKETPKTYETAATRLFKNARTETIRPVSDHSVNFTKTFDDPTIPIAEKVHHLKTAVHYQTKYKYDAMNGRVVDRHLLGLYVAGKLTGQIPKLFSLKPFCEADRLSTSQSPLYYDPVIGKVTPHEPVGGGFGAQRPDGYGVTYFMDENEVSLLVSSFKSCAETGSLLFANAIEKAVDDIKSLMEANLKSAKEN